MDNHSDLEAEVTTVRRQLAEAIASASAHKNQLEEAKAKAKAIIQRKMDEADAKAKLLDEQNKLQREELVKLKSILRQTDEERNRLVDECDRVKTQLEETQSQNAELKHLCSSPEADAHDSASRAVSVVGAKEAELQREVEILQTELNYLKRTSARAESEDSPARVFRDDTEHSESKYELLRTEESIERLRSELDELRNENQVLRSVASNKDKDIEREDKDNSSKVSVLREETRKSNERIQILSQELEEAKNDTKTKKSEYEKAIHEAEREKASLEEQLQTSKARVTELLQNLQTSELTLKDEREKAIQERKIRTESPALEGEQKNKILEAKVSEMERVVASKQAEISKVREKAKTYLRELNAEKRAMETKMKEEAEVLERELEDERKKVEAAERRAESASIEIDNCLALIRDKQKSVQMLKMTVSIQKSAAEEAARESKSLREEFARYKERARLALQERDTAAESIESSIETATVRLRRDLQVARKESSHLKTRLQYYTDLQKRHDEALERAERAEAAADLLRKDTTGVSITNFSQVDLLEEKLAEMEGELNRARAAMEDAEAKLETTTMRLEATEKALRGAEVRAEETERISQKAIEGQRSHVESLKRELARAQESAAAAQRTAAAAAKALALSSPDNRETKQKHAPKSEAVDKELREDSNILSFGNPSAVYTGRATLAAAMEGHSDGLGLQTSFDSQTSGSPALESELQMKQQQILVLTSQITELGALLDEVQHEAELRSEETTLLKAEVKNLDSKLAAAERLQNGAPFSYLRTIVVRYLETDDATLLPVIANVLSFTEEESLRVKTRRGTKTIPSASPKGGYFGLNGFLGTR